MSVQISYRLALATCAHLPGIYPDDVHLASSLKRLGIEPTSCIWNDPAVDWSRFDAVLMRTTWDYFKHYAAFTHWLDRLPIPTINGKPLLRWNSEKRYLLKLEQHGVDIIPTRIAPAAGLRETLTAMHGQDVVVKPTVSGGGWHTLRGIAGDAAFEQALAQLPQDLDYMVQAFVPEIVDDGEWSLLFFEGRYSHAVIKRAAAGDYRVQSEFGGSVEVVEPDAAIIASAQRVLTATAAIGHGDHAYARVDGVVVSGRFQLMELEMVEPTLFLSNRPDVAERFAGNLRRRLDAMSGSISAAAYHCPTHLELS
jgi:glutathione synthase/RimK-type ligase-like ATP-grasp enzyme